MSCQCRECRGKSCVCMLCSQMKNCGYAMLDDCRWEIIQEDANRVGTIKFQIFLRNTHMDISGRNATIMS
ncbi:hypothetical protein DEAC_c28590 [Desulfosporosinus acididurans]|uniref:Uncharacterized protein n=1 Tax=Desulfosporosinus acididurans TaxID=476652 RepID=A0A0J1FPQ3_9FIRM|nr:hypothetical protein DEAC_c28590 [Desulfosporosinus acididurans]